MILPWNKNKEAYRLYYKFRTFAIKNKEEIMKDVFSKEGMREWKSAIKSINSSKENAIKFYKSVGILTPTGRISKAYRSQNNKKVE